ncbi:MAG: hypothetical protein RR614_11130, partial [Eubacterium sp.]
FTGMTGDTVERAVKSGSTDASQGAAGSWSTMTQGGASSILDSLTGSNSGLANPSGTSLVNLAATVLTVLMALSAFVFKRKRKALSLAVGIVVIVLFFITQPLSMSFILFDRWSPLFLALLMTAAALVLGKVKKKSPQS